MMKKVKTLVAALSFMGYTGTAQIISTVSGSGSGSVNTPYSIVCDASGNVFFNDFGSGGGGHGQIVKIDTYNEFTTLCTYTGALGGMAIDASGNIYFTDYNYCVRKVTPSGVVSVVAGNATTTGFSGDGGAATSALLNSPTDVAVDASGNLYIMDGSNYRIRKVNTSGIITTIAGNGTAGHTGDGGAATSAEIGGMGICLDNSGNIYFTEYAYNYVRKINTSGIISTVAGTGIAGYTGNGGAATSAELNSPSDITFDASNNMYIVERINNGVRQVNTSGIINPYVNNTTSFGSTGDGGLAIYATLSDPSSIAFDPSGNAYVLDVSNKIRKVSTLCPANAGPNITNQKPCCGSWGTVQIGTPSVPNMTYSWASSTNLNSTTIAQPTSSYSNTSTCITYTVTVSYSLCTTSTSTVQVCAHVPASCCRIATGISSENQEEHNFAVYPNPTTGYITISLYNKTTSVTLIDVQGRIIFESSDLNIGDLNLDMSKYNKGIYYLSVKIDDKIQHQKIVLE